MNMFPRRRALVVLLAALPLLAASSGCKRKKVQVQATEEEAPRMASMVHMGDPKAQAQLVSGFYDIEQNAWRWAQKKFSVALRPPLGAAQKGATLTLKYTVPDVILSKLQSITITPTVNGTALAPETISKAGDYTLTRDVASTLLTGDSARVDFALDKALAPSESDQRELGIVVLSIGLEPK